MTKALLERLALSIGRTRPGKRVIAFLAGNIPEAFPWSKEPGVGCAPDLLKLMRTYDRTRGTYERLDGTVDDCSTEIEVCQFLYRLICMFKPHDILETGTYRGLSTCFLAAAVRDSGGAGTVTTIDPWQMPHLWDGTELAPYIRWLAERSDQVNFGDRRFDLLLIDSEHTYRTSAGELSNFEPLVRPGGYILMHDSLLHDGVGYAASKLYQDSRFEVITFDTPRRLQFATISKPVPIGLAVARKTMDGPRLVVWDEYLGMPEHVPEGPYTILRQHAITRAQDGWWRKHRAASQ